MKIKKSKKISFLLIIIGLCLILFPFVMKIISSFEQTIVINNYKNDVSQISQENLLELEENAANFNNDLFENNTFDSNLSQDSISSIDFANKEILAYITIPKLNLELPIYEGCSDNVLSLGIGHLPTTSLPVGGSNTHSVLVGHTGLTHSIMFDDLDKLHIGDTFSINSYNNILNYEVCQINIVEPDDTHSLIIKPNEDLVTLVTCTPKHVNTYRLLVTGKRVNLDKIPYNKIENNFTNDENNKTNSYLEQNIPLIVNVIFVHLFLIFIIIFVMKFLRKK